MDGGADNGDKESEGHRALAHLVRVALSGASRLDCAELDCSWNAHRLVPAHQTEYKADDEGEHGAVGVGELPVEDQRKLGEDNDEHEVAAEDEEVVDAAVGDGQAGGDDAVDDDAHPQSPDHLLLTTVGPDHLYIDVRVWQQSPLRPTF